MNRLSSLDVWVRVFSIFGVAGIILAVFGMLAGIAWARTTGLVLMSPIVLMGILLVVVGFPILIVANYRHAQQTRDDRDGPRDDVHPM